MIYLIVSVLALAYLLIWVFAAAARRGDDLAANCPCRIHR